MTDERTITTNMPEPWMTGTVCGYFDFCLQCNAPVFLGHHPLPDGWRLTLRTKAGILWITTHRPGCDA